MKIAEISAVFPPYRGGIGSVCAQNAEMLAEAGHEVAVFTPWYRHLRRAHVPLEETVGKVNVRRLKPFIDYGNAAVIPQLGRYLKSYDAIHVHLPFIGVGKVFSKMKKKGKKIIATYHMDLEGRGWKRGVFTKYQQKVLPRVLDACDKVIVSSEDYGLHSNISDYMDADPKKFLAIPNTVDTLRFYPKEKNGALMKRIGVDSQDYVGLFVGGLDSAHYFKGVEYLLEAFEYIVHSETSAVRAAHYKLVIVGEGDLRPRYENLAGQLGIADKVLFVGSASPEELVDYYNMCDVTILPSVDSSEAFGVVLVEAMACGKPVIASNIPGPRSVVQDGVNGYLVRPREASHLAEKMYAIFNDHEQAVEMGHKGKALVEKKYSYETVSGQFVSLFE